MSAPLFCYIRTYRGLACRVCDNRDLTHYLRVCHPSFLLYAREPISMSGVKVIGTPQHKALVALIRAERKAAGLRQVDLAKRLGEQQQWVALVERGQRRISVVEFLALAQAIGFDPAKATKKLARIKN